MRMTDDQFATILRIVRELGDVNVEYSWEEDLLTFTLYAKFETKILKYIIDIDGNIVR